MYLCRHLFKFTSPRQSTPYFTTANIGASSSCKGQVGHNPAHFVCQQPIGFAWFAAFCRFYTRVGFWCRVGFFTDSSWAQLKNHKTLELTAEKTVNLQ
jgi:hypothetical protein